MYSTHLVICGSHFVPECILDRGLHWQLIKALIHVAAPHQRCVRYAGWLRARRKQSEGIITFPNCLLCVNVKTANARADQICNVFLLHSCKSLVEVSNWNRRVILFLDVLRPCAWCNAIALQEHGAAISSRSGPVLDQNHILLEL